MAEQRKSTTQPKGSKSISFIAEIKQVSTKKTASLDLEYRVVFASDDPTVNSLGLVQADQLVNVTVELA